jgi:hypothetical protein
LEKGWVKGVWDTLIGCYTQMFTSLLMGPSITWKEEKKKENLIEWNCGCHWGTHDLAQWQSQDHLEKQRGKERKKRNKRREKIIWVNEWSMSSINYFACGKKLYVQPKLCYIVEVSTTVIDFMLFILSNSKDICSYLDDQVFYLCGRPSLFYRILMKCITCWRNKKMIHLSNLRWYCFIQKWCYLFTIEEWSIVL